MGRFMLTDAGPPPARKPTARERHGNLEVTVEFSDTAPSTNEARAVECFLRPELLKAGIYGP